MHDPDTAAILVHASALFKLALGMSTQNTLSLGHPTDQDLQIHEIRDAVEILHPVSRNAKVEVLQALYMDRKDRLIVHRILNSGTENRTLFCPRQVLQPAMQLDAHNLILAHNHPSGIKTPSTADIRATYHLIDVARHLGVQVRDHIILTQMGYFSMRSEGLLCPHSVV